MSKVIVDDRNSLLTYTGNWDSTLGGPSEYNITTTSPLQRGANVTFEFTGTSVSVYGTSGRGESTTCEFTVDGGHFGTFTVPLINRGSVVYHTKFYSASNLPNGTHTLHMSVTNIGNSSTGMESNFYLDYIVYTPSANASSSSPTLGEGQLYFFDDTDPAFNYSGSWSTDQGKVQDMHDTVHGALSRNSSVSLQFTGTYVDVYGRLPLSSNLTSVAQFVIDDGIPLVSNYPSSIQNVTFHDAASSNYRLYHNASLSPGSHLLVITPAAEQALWLDYVTVGPGTVTSNPGDSAPSASPLSSLPSSSLPSSSTDGAPSASLLADSTTHGPSPTGSVSPSPSSARLSNAAIAGVIVSSIACFALVVLILMCLRRQRNQHKRLGDLAPNPYTFPDSQNNFADTLPGAMSDVRSASLVAHNPDSIAATQYIHFHNHPYGSTIAISPVEPELGSGWRREKAPRVHGPVVASPTDTVSVSVPPSFSDPVPSTDTTSTHTLVSPTSQAHIRHQDSGMRGLFPPVIVATPHELPPLYSAD